MANVKLPSFPNSYITPFQETSDSTWRYNCIAWALEINDRWYWPGNRHQYWPSDIPREVTLDAFIKLYEKHGYEICDNGDYEHGYVKVAIFELDGVPQHAARQWSQTEWTSKLGESIDVSHTIEAMEDGKYGNVSQYMKKKISRFQARRMKSR